MLTRVQSARGDPNRVVLEGFHALKHALRFGAELELVITCDASQLQELCLAHGADVAPRVKALAIEITRRTFKQLGPYEPHTGVVSIAGRRRHDAHQLLAGRGPEPLVLLEDPRHRGNLGAVIRVAAAADVAGVLTTGAQDPWNPVVLRGSAGLHYALPVAQLESLPATDRALIAFDPSGASWRAELLAPRAVLAFGSEREGCSADLLARAEQVVCLPMRAGVSSLNLATSVAAVLYGRRLASEALARSRLGGDARR